MVTTLERKLLRDLLRLRGQVISIALVVACGIAALITMRSAYASLLESRDYYYDNYRFADLFVSLERAPNNLQDRLEGLPGVSVVYPRVVEPVMVPIETMPRPASGSLVSLPDRGEPALNRVFLKRGRALEPGRANEALLLAGFAEAHRIAPGDSLQVVINGRVRRLTIVGLAMSPEHVMTMSPGDMTYDPKRFAVLWMNRSAVSAAFDMQGAFSDVVFSLQPGADRAVVVEHVERLLAPYGGATALLRDKQPSNYMISGELVQLKQMATSVPIIFLLVAAFLLNVVLSRLVLLERSQIATLKAIGYPDLWIGLHYMKLTAIVVTIGAVFGIGLGAWLGKSLTGLYTGEFFRFPHTRYLLEPKVIVIAVAVSLLAGLTGALLAVRQVVKMPPAEAMRPAAPAKYKKTLLERAGLFQFFSSSAKMVWREIERKPLRQLLSALGISMAVGIVMISGFMRDAISYLMQVQFHEAMREDVTVTFVKPLDERATRELAHIDGVHLAEGLSSVPVRFRSGHLYRDSALTGYQPNGTLRRILDSEGKSHPLPAHGVLLTQKLAELLGVKVGSTITVELKQGTRSSHSLYVGGLVDEPFGLFGHIRAAKLDQMLGAEPTVTTALLKVDPYARDDIEQRLKRLPWVLAVSSPRDFKTQFDQQSGQLMGIYTLILTLFASVIAVGVIYNNARVALSQRSRDLASLRVLGFQRSEISAILFGELSVQVLLALPLGMWIGHQMILGINSSVDPETYRLPIIVSLGTYAYAALVAIASAVLSALLVRRKISQLDMIAVLKTRE